MSGGVVKRDYTSTHETFAGSPVSPIKEQHIRTRLILKLEGIATAAPRAFTGTDTNSFAGNSSANPNTSQASP
jgi:hypothetical protein